MFIWVGNSTVFLYQRFSNCGVRPPGRGAVGPLGGGRLDCVRNIFIWNEIWAKSKIHIDRHFLWLKYFTYHLVPVLDPNYKQHILSPANVRKVCYSLDELYVGCVYLNVFGCSGARGL
jgi:hypothetical protein